MIFTFINNYEKWIKEYKIKRFRQTEGAHELTIEILFIDDSELIARDYLFLDGTRKYSYHYQDNTKKLIFRYDDKPHWKNLKTFPYHKHTKSGVIESKVMNLEKVLEEVVNIVKLALST